MTSYTMQNPAFVAYLAAAAIMILKLMGQAWITVYRMIRSEAGLLNPEDLQPGPANRNPHPRQLERNEYVERSRRINLNDLENIPAFLAAGLLFVAVDPPFLLASILMAIFVIARLFHTVAYATAQRHEVRATLFSVGSLVVIFMALYVLVAVFLLK
jgi:glutathione S-transferase